VIEARCYYCKELVPTAWDELPRDADGPYGMSVEWCPHCRETVPVRHGDGGTCFDAWSRDIAVVLK
jgi:hypothetical protein